jgi:hypothetical protein
MSLASGPTRRPAPAPPPWPLLVFALVALAASLASAVVRLRQPIAPPPLPPAASAAVLPSPPPRVPARERATAADGSVSVAGAPPGSVGSSPSAPGALRASPGPAVGGATRATGVTPVGTIAATAPPTAAAPTAAPSTASVAAEPGAAAVTSVSPPLLRRGATALVDVHGVGLRSDHQVRIGRGRDSARGVEVVRQRYVGPALLQVLLRVDPSAAPGAHVLFLVDGAGHNTNPRPLEIVK